MRTGHATPVTVNVLTDGIRLDDRSEQLVARAVGEAVANALEHADASRITVFAEATTDGGAFASVRDDGVGFDPDAVHDGQGITESIVGRMTSLGGRAELRSATGAGTEVTLWAPPVRGSRS